MTIEFLPIPLPPSADASRLSKFGREVKGFNPGKEWTDEEFRVIEEGLYKVRFSFFRFVIPQLDLVGKFDRTDSTICCCLGIVSFRRRDSWLWCR